MISADVIEIDQELCDGCGNCVTACAEGAIALVDGKARLIGEFACDGVGVCLSHCPRGAITIIPRAEYPPLGRPACPFAAGTAATISGSESPVETSRPAQWPVKLELIAPSATFLKGADLLLVADCAPMVCRDFHDRFGSGKVVALACPKLGNAQAQQTRLNEIVATAHPGSLTVVRMEVPCCGGLAFFARKATASDGNGLPIREIVLTSSGEELG